jgi:hypothetical protein
VIILVTPARTRAGPTACAAVVHNGHRYLVFKQNVLCSYARATALKMLRRQQPYIVEFVSPGKSPAWKCRILGSGATERGACDKRTERRWLLYFPAAK